MSKFLYTVVCRYYTMSGIIELDLYEVFKRLRIDPYIIVDNVGYDQIHRVIHYHVYTGQAVEYVIKRVIRDIKINEKTRRFYSYYSPYSLMYDCLYDLKDVRKMNDESIRVRLKMSDEDFYRVYGGGLK